MRLALLARARIGRILLHLRGIRAGVVLLQCLPHAFALFAVGLFLAASRLRIVGLGRRRLPVGGRRALRFGGRLPRLRWRRGTVIALLRWLAFARVARLPLPAAGRRLVQRATGYRATFVAGVQTVADDEFTGALPGRLLRAGN